MHQNLFIIFSWGGGGGGGGGGAFFRSRRSLFLIVETTGVYSDPAIARTRVILREKTVYIFVT